MAQRAFELVEYDVGPFEAPYLGLMVEPGFTLASCAHGLRHDCHA